VWTNNAWAVVEDLKFINDPLLFGRHITELNASDNALVRTYVWGLDLSGTEQGAGGVGGLLWLTSFQLPASSSTYFAAYDGNGNVAALLHAPSSMPHAHYEYGPFGEPLRITGPAAGQHPFRFSTKRTDPTTDLVLYEYRAYNPVVGCWLSRDPIAETGGKNLYGFVRNRPTKGLDFLGLCKIGEKQTNCQAKVMAWGHVPQVEEAARDLALFIDVVGTLQYAGVVAEVLVAALMQGGVAAVEAAGPAVAEALFEAGYGRALDEHAIASMVSVAVQEFRGYWGGWYIWTKVSYKECVCSWIFFTRWQEKRFGPWKRSAKFYPGYTLPWDDGRFLTKVHATAKADDACKEHIMEVMSGQ